MRKRRLETGAIIAVFVLLPVISFSISLLPIVNARTTAPNEFQDLMKLADEAAPKTAKSTAPPRGERIDAPLEKETSSVNADAAAPIRRLDPSAVKTSEALDKALSRSSSNADFEKTQNGEYFKVSFSDLGSYKYTEPDPDTVKKMLNPDTAPQSQIPKKIKRLNQEKVVVVGFMVPLQVTRDEYVTLFALTQNQSYCCYGVAPALNEWIMVTVPSSVKVKPNMDTPVAVFGTMEVGEDVKDDYVMSIYRMNVLQVMDASQLAARLQKGSDGASSDAAPE